jgi:hypothetical protein
MNKDKITFRNFWPGNDVTKLFIYNLLESTNHCERNIVVTSVFNSSSITKKAIYYYKNKFNLPITIDEKLASMYKIDKPVFKNDTLNVWYTGENLRPPPDDGWDLILSFETSKISPKHIHLPFWATRLGENIQEAQINQKKFMTRRHLTDERQNFACAVFNNPEPIRLKAIQEISKIMNVDLYGSIFDKRIQDKIKILNDYNFSICFENDLYPGYITEKVFDAWAAGTVPIWWGVDNTGLLNKNAIINFADEDFNSNIVKLKEILSNNKLLISMRNEPLLNFAYDYDELFNSVQTILCDL